MKLSTLLLAVGCSGLLQAQEPIFKKNKQGEFERTEVVLVDSFSAAQLYFNAKLFLKDAFQGVRETSQIKDDKSKTVATKGSFPVTIENAYGEEVKARVYFTLVIQAREGMYRYTMNDLYFGFTEESGITSYASFNDKRGVQMNAKQWQFVESQTADFTTLFLADLKEQMQQFEILCKEELAASRKKKK